MKSYGVIYLITCLANGKIYVGQTRQVYVRDRWYDHVYKARRGADTYLCAAIRKYGEAAFSITIIERCNVNRLNQRERFHIRRLRSTDRRIGYNLSAGGDGGQNLTPDVRAKISASKKGVKAGPMSDERREAVRFGKIVSGYRHSVETIRKITEKRRAYRLTDSHKKAISDGLKRTRKFKLSRFAVRRIKRLLDKNSDSALHRRFKIARRTISKIRAGTYEGPS